MKYIILIALMLLTFTNISYGRDCPRGVYPPERFEHIEVVTVCGEGTGDTKQSARENAHIQTVKEFMKVHSDRYKYQQIKKVVGDEKCSQTNGKYICAMYIDYQINLSEKKEEIISDNIAKQLLENQKKFMFDQKTFQKETKDNFKKVNKRIDTELARVSLEKIEINKKIKKLNEAIKVNEKLKEKANKLEEIVSKINAKIKAHQNKIINTVYTGMSIDNLKKELGIPVGDIAYRKVCSANTQEFWGSNHGNLIICWTDLNRSSAVVSAVCSRETLKCIKNTWGG